MYIPPSQIITGLSTNGEEYILSTTGEPYSGVYFKTLTGKAYTGQTPSPTSILLTSRLTFNPADIEDINNGSLYNSFIESVNEKANFFEQEKYINREWREVRIPTNVKVTPQDIKNGYVKRYFLRNLRTLTFLETNSDYFGKIYSRDPKVAWDMYDFAYVQWFIKGQKEKVYEKNKKNVKNIEEAFSYKNSLGKNWIGFSLYFKDNFLQFYVVS